ncbi:MAG TPA: bifunctional (p)ppGpp synthetase/guanosine-3',5'-bis(diphosphate) 3'-pyrophosphohydrolase [Dehalococcoidia bacterium]|nr:bifunctional (p)ppGpp synthetase/guanosine-3',5'-bis(diphosphate) 3'-pyrophosphohydrolase [Dehalococcoidia bacterium]
MHFRTLLKKAREYLPPEKISVVEDAYHYAAEKHRGQTRLSGDPYLEHPLQTAMILAEFQLDHSTLAAGLLHDIPEDCGLPVEEIKSRFGSEIARLVDGVTKLKQVSSTASGAVVTSNQADNFKKMLITMAEDLRVVFIKLADRLHNMRTLDALPAERQLAIARETMEIYAPLANVLGIWEWKSELEDLAFQYIDPEMYDDIEKEINSQQKQWQSFIRRVIHALETEFDRVGLVADISGRLKHIYGIYRKKKKYAAMGRHFDKIYDIFAVRVIVDESDCYNAFGAIHGLWHPVPGTFDNYISTPKPNGYRAIHTVVRAFGTTPVEIQIRSHDMHEVAEHGEASHWKYKEGEHKDKQLGESVARMREHIESNLSLTGGDEFMEAIKTDVFTDQVFVYTPKGEIKDMPRGSTPLDFAYRVHTELGHRCIGAKVNDRLVAFNYELRNGDVVEIITAKTDKGPSLDWLNENLGYVHTSHARNKIRQWFNKQERAENIENGRLILEKELRHLGMQIDRQLLAEMFGYTNPDDFLAALGNGAITAPQLVFKLASREEEPELPEAAPPRRVSPSAVRVLGVGDLVTNLADCCNPLPGDNIIGYITRNRGVTIHRADCQNVVNEKEKERLVNVEWGQSDLLYPVNIQVEAWDRVGLMSDITTVVAEEQVNIAGVKMAEGDNHKITVDLTLETRGLTHLSQVMKKIDAVKSVLGVSRMGDAVVKKAKVNSSKSMIEIKKPD